MRDWKQEAVDSYIIRPRSRNSSTWSNRSHPSPAQSFASVQAGQAYSSYQLPGRFINTRKKKIASDSPEILRAPQNGVLLSGPTNSSLSRRLRVGAGMLEDSVKLLFCIMSVMPDPMPAVARQCGDIGPEPAALRHFRRETAKKTKSVQRQR